MLVNLESTVVKGVCGNFTTAQHMKLLIADMRIKVASLDRPYVPSLLFYTPWLVVLKHDTYKTTKNSIKCN
jgi:hypothetical protein